MVQLKTYRDLIAFLSSWDLDQSISVFDGTTGEYYGISSIDESSESNDVLDPGSIVLTIFSKTEESD